MCTFRTPYYKYQRYASSEKKSRDSSPKKPVVGCSLHPSAMRFFVLLFPAGSENLLLHFVKAARPRRRSRMVLFIQCLKEETRSDQRGVF